MSAKQTQKPVSERIALVAPSGTSLVRLRSDLLADFGRRGHRVLCITPHAPGKIQRELKKLGAQHRAVEFEVSGLNLLNDWRVTTKLIEIFKEWAPNVVLGFGIKPLINAAIAARRAGVRRTVSVVSESLEATLPEVGSRRFIQALRASDAAVFFNRGDLSYLESRGLHPGNLERIIVPGAGVDLVRFPSAPLPDIEGGLVFLMLARLERSRGVLDYAGAAGKLKSAVPRARFTLAGPFSSARDRLSLDDILKASGGAIEYLGDLDDVRPALSSCHVFVYPSYAEGMPRAVLEALATGRPVITSNVSGCRETIDERVSGCLVAPADVAALASTMESFLKRPAQISSMSRAARLKVERRFSVADVNRRIFELIGLPFDAA